MDEYGCGSIGLWNIYYIIYLTLWLSRFINGIASMWDYMLWCIVSLLMWTGIWKKLRMYRVNPLQIKWYCQGFGYRCISFMIIYIIIPKIGLSLSHRRQYYAPSYVSFITYLMYFGCVVYF